MTNPAYEPVEIDYPAPDFVITNDSQWGELNNPAHTCIGVAPGLYVEDHILITLSGTAENPRYLRWYDPANPTDITTHPYHMAENKRAILRQIDYIKADYWIIDRLSFTGGRHTALGDDPNREKASNNVLNKLYFYENNSGVMLRFSYSANNIVQNSVFRWTWIQADTDSYVIYHHDSDNELITNNEFIDFGGGIQESGPTKNNHVAYKNEFYLTSARYTDGAGNFDPAGDFMASEGMVFVPKIATYPGNVYIFQSNLIYGVRKWDSSGLGGGDGTPGAAIALGPGNVGFDGADIINNIILNATPSNVIFSDNTANIKVAGNIIGYGDGGILNGYGDTSEITDNVYFDNKRDVAIWGNAAAGNTLYRNNRRGTEAEKSEITFEVQKWTNPQQSSIAALEGPYRLLPSSSAPLAPVATASIEGANLRISWTPPTKREDGTDIAALGTYDIYWYDAAGLMISATTRPGTEVSGKLDNFADYAESAIYATVTAVDGSTGHYGAPSNIVEFPVGFSITDVDGDNEVVSGQTDVVITVVDAGNVEGPVTYGGVTQSVSSWTDTEITLAAIDSTGLTVGEDYQMLCQKPANRNMILEFTTAVAGETIEILAADFGSYAGGKIHWDETTTQTLTAYNDTMTNVFADAGTHIVEIEGPFPAIKFNQLGSIAKLTKILQLGDVGWLSANSAFWGAVACTELRVGIHDFSNVADITLMFRDFTNPAVTAPDFETFTCAPTLIGSMFNGWKGAAGPDCTGIDVSGVANFGYVLAAHHNAITPANTTGWQTTSATHMLHMRSSGYAAETPPDVAYDVSGVQFFNNMLQYYYGPVSPMDIPIDEWVLTQCATNAMFTNFLLGSQLTTACYDRVLASWAAQDLSGVTTDIHFGNSLCTGGAANADRIAIIADIAGTIIDGHS